MNLVYFFYNFGNFGNDVFYASTKVEVESEHTLSLGILSYSAKIVKSVLSQKAPVQRKISVGGQLKKVISLLFFMPCCSSLPIQFKL